MRNTYEFELTEASARYVKMFEKQHEYCPKGMAFDQFSYTFVPTSIGLLCTVRCSCGRELYLSSDTPSEEMEPYDENKYRPLTEKERDNECFEEGIKRILLFKNPHTYRIAFRREQSFDGLLGYAFGIIDHQKDTRLGSCVLKANEAYGDDPGSAEDLNSDKEKIELFCRVFAIEAKKELELYQSTNVELMKRLEELIEVKSEV